MTGSAVGICALAVHFPSVIRTNKYWSEQFPALAVQAQSKRVRSAKSFQLSGNSELDIWSQEVAPYLADPFRGNVERRVLGQEESPLMLECGAAEEVLMAANLCPDDLDLMIVSSLFSEPIGVGNAPYLARQLGLRCPAWNLDSTCSSALVALQTAHRLVQTGEYRNVLVVISQFGSRVVNEADTLSWSMGDGVGAFVVSSLQPNQGILGTHVISTTATCGAYSYELITDAGVPRMRTRTGENASAIAETAVEFVRTCCEAAVAKAGVSLDQVAFFAFNTPTAWYANVCTRALGIDPERTINLYPRYANIGAVLPIANLYHAAEAGKLRENDLVLVYTNGAGATAGATTMRWGNVALGNVPAPPLEVAPEQEQIRFTPPNLVTPPNLPLPREGAMSSPLPLLRRGAAGGGVSREILLAATPAQRRSMLEAYLLEWLTRSLSCAADPFTLEQPLATVLDSLLALTLKNRIETDLRVPVPMEQFFGENTIAHLVEHLLNQLALASLISPVATPKLSATADADAEYRETLSL